MAPPKPRPSFGEFVAPQAPSQRFLDRSAFAGKSPEEAVACLMEFESDKKDLEAVTRNQKQMVVRMVLRDLQARGKDLGSVTEADVRAYRAFLLHLVEQRKANPDEGISQDYAAHVVSQWNSIMRAVFGDQSRPGEGLIMRNFTQSPKKVQRYGDDDMLRLIAALPHKRFQNQHYRELVHTYLELAWCTCGRIGSINTEALTWEHVDWDRKVLSFKHMKNVDGLRPRRLKPIGLRLRTCANCRHDNGPEAVFCERCSHAIHPDAIQTIEERRGRDLQKQLAAMAKRLHDELLETMKGELAAAAADEPESR